MPTEIKKTGRKRIGEFICMCGQNRTREYEKTYRVTESKKFIETINLLPHLSREMYILTGKGTKSHRIYND